MASMNGSDRFIHRSAWNRNSTNFALWAFCEVRVGLFFGALSGAVVGLPLGVLDGVLLSWLAVRYSYHERPNARRYRARAGIVCAVGNLLALVAD
jgi:Na+/H+ antiporter NhaA